MACFLLNPNVIRLGLSSLLTMYSLNEIEDLLKSCNISRLLDYHVLRHFKNNKCGEDCVIEVAEKIKIKEQYFAENDIPYIKGEGNCKHGCLIEVRMSIPPGKDEWEIGTSFHKGPCLVK
jgi:hypothetical protein